MWRSSTTTVIFGLGELGRPGDVERHGLALAHDDAAADRLDAGVADLDVVGAGRQLDDLVVAVVVGGDGARRRR